MTIIYYLLKMVMFILYYLYSNTKVAATCVKDGNVGYYLCENSKLMFNNAEGTEIITSVVIPATGEHVYANGKCTMCEATDPAATPAEPAKPADKVSDGTTETGDDANILLPMGLALAALLGMGALVATRRYMLAQNIAEAASGIDKLVSRVLVLAE